MLCVLDVVRGDVEWWREASCDGVESELTLSVAVTSLLLAMGEGLSTSVTLALWPRENNAAELGMGTRFVVPLSWLEAEERPSAQRPPLWFDGQGGERRSERGEANLDAY